MKQVTLGLVAVLAGLVSLLCASAAAAQSAENIYKEKLAALRADDANAHYDLGRWCLQNALADQAKERFEQAVKLDPDHREAHLSLGHLKCQDKWLSRDDAQKQGLVRYGGYWTKPQELKSLREKDRAAIGWRFECKLETLHFFVYSTAPEDVAERVGAIADGAYEAFMQLLQGPLGLEPTKRLLHIRLCKNEQEFAAARKSPTPSGMFGCYTSPCGKLPGYSMLFDGGGDLDRPVRHEVTHLIWHEAAGAGYLRPNAILWLSEGLATCFADCKMECGALCLDEISKPAEFHMVCAAIYPMKTRDVVSAVGYAQYFEDNAWALTYFLFNYDKGRYREGFLKYLGDACKSRIKPGDVASFEKLVGKTEAIDGEMAEYVKKLRTEHNLDNARPAQPK